MGQDIVHFAGDDQALLYLSSFDVGLFLALESLVLRT